MIGIILIGHAHLATEAKAAAEHILGVQPSFAAVDICDSDVSPRSQKKFELLLEAMDAGQGILVMADLYGATPCNMVQTKVGKHHIEVVAGFNMPAVIKAVTTRQTDIGLKKLAETVVAAGQQYLCLSVEMKGSKTEGL